LNRVLKIQNNDVLGIRIIQKLMQSEKRACLYSRQALPNLNDLRQY
jgi:hypothetical protein